MSGRSTTPVSYSPSPAGTSRFTAGGSGPGRDADLSALLDLHLDGKELVQQRGGHPEVVRDSGGGEVRRSRRGGAELAGRQEPGGDEDLIRQMLVERTGRLHEIRQCVRGLGPHVLGARAPVPHRGEGGEGVLELGPDEDQRAGRLPDGKGQVLRVAVDAAFPERVLPRARLPCTDLAPN